MRRLTPIEKSAIALGLVLVAVGVFMIVYPMDDLVVPPLRNRSGTVVYPPKPEQMSNLGAQICGGIAIVIGAGITWLALFRGGK